MNIRRFIFALFVITSLFAVFILSWFFFIKKPTTDTTINTPTNPFNKVVESVRGSEFINNFFDDNQTSETEITEGKELRLAKIWDKPTAGFSFFNETIIVTSTSSKLIKGTSTEVLVQSKATSTKMIFADRQTGYIYALGVKDKKPYQITNTLMIGIYDAYFFDNAQSVIIRYLNDSNNIISVLAKVPRVAENNTPLPLEEITYLPNNVTSISVSNSQRTVNYLVKTDTGGAIYALDKNKKVYLKTLLPLSELNLNHGGEILYFTPKASAYISGYTINTETNERIIGDKTGLVTTPANNNVDYLSSMWSVSGLTTFIFNKEKIENRILDLKTISQKCTWEKSSLYVICGVPKEIERTNGSLPDDWYQGRVLFEDDLYIVGNKFKTENLLFSFESDTQDKIDTIKPLLTSSNEYLGFINKRDGNLWLLHTLPLLLGN